MARKAQKTEQVASIWDDLGLPAPQNNSPAVQTTGGTRGDDGQSKVILDRLERLERDRSLDSYREGPRQADQGYQVDPNTLRFDPTGLPDPLVDKDKYNQAVADRVNAVVMANREAVRAELTTRQTTTDATTKLWNDMVRLHPEWDGHKALVGAVAGEVVEDLKSRGIDTSRFVFQESEKFAGMVQDRIERSGYGAVFAGSDDDDDEGDQRSQVRKPIQTRPGGMSEQEELRTEGIMGGLESGGAPGKTPKEQPTDMIADMKAIQERIFNRPL